MDSDQGKLFIGGISWETSEEKLKDYFKSYGEVVETVIMRDRTTGRARGFGFVVFADPAVADRVLLEKHTIEGRVVEAKKAVPRDEQQNFARSNNGGPMPGGQIRTKKIFVGGLASTVTEDDFKRYFEQFGNITDVVVMYDHSTQRPRGFGFITFDSEDAVDQVLQKSFHELHDKMVEVKRAIPKELSTGPAGRTNGGGFGAGVGRASNYNSGYGQGYNSSPGGIYGARMDTRFGPVPGGRGGYPTYGPGGYATAGYGASGGFGAAVNGAYAGSGYSAGAGYGAPGTYAGGFGNTPSGTGYGGAGGYATAGAVSGGYASVPPAGPRSPWGSAGAGFASGGSPASYGAIGGGNMSGYGPPAGGSAAYSISGYGYGTNEAGYSSSPAGYGARGGNYGGVATGGAASYEDGYGGAAYTEPAWRSGGADSHSSPAAGTGGANAVGYAIGVAGAGVDGAANGSANYGGGYGVAGRQTQRGPDARFRPYPSAGERTA